MWFLREQMHCLLMSTVILALPAVAQAQTSITRFTVYMHSGPNRQFAVTDEIPSQTPLMPDTCVGGWCRIRYGNVLGWVEQSMLANSPPLAQPQPGQRPVNCFDFARTGWPDAGDLERVCIFSPKPGATLLEPKTPGG